MATDKTIKVWKVSRTSPAGMVVSEKSAAVVGSEHNALIVDDKGITLAGPISIVADGSDIRRGGIFVGQNDFIQMIPSTIVTPIPSQIPQIPQVGLNGLTKDVAFFLALLV